MLWAGFGKEVYFEERRDALAKLGICRRFPSIRIVSRSTNIGEDSMADTFARGYALLIGVGTTAYTPWSLPVTVKDVNALRAVLIDPALCGYPDHDDHVRVLHDGGATRAAILDGVAWLKSQTSADPNATAILFYSGHGCLDKTNGRYFLISHDAKPHNVPDSALSSEDFTAALGKVKARRLLAVVDACHAQGMATSKASAIPLDLPVGMTQAAVTEGKGVLAALKEGEGRAVFSSSRDDQRSWVRSDGSLSVFTHHLLEALLGAGSKAGEAEVRLSNLMGYLGRAVPASVRRMYSADQVPFFDTATEDFPVALLRGGKGLPARGWNAAELEVERDNRPVISAVASGERAVAVGGSLSGATIITGDGHKS
jgi:Caspase domain